MTDMSPNIDMNVTIGAHQQLELVAVKQDNNMLKDVQVPPPKYTDEDDEATSTAVAVATAAAAAAAGPEQMVEDTLDIHTNQHQHHTPLPNVPTDVDTSAMIAEAGK